MAKTKVEVISTMGIEPDDMRKYNWQAQRLGYTDFREFCSDHRPDYRDLLKHKSLEMDQELDEAAFELQESVQKAARTFAQEMSKVEEALQQAVREAAEEEEKVEEDVSDEKWYLVRILFDGGQTAEGYLNKDGCQELIDVLPLGKALFALSFLDSSFAWWIRADKIISVGIQGMEEVEKRD